MGRIFLDGKIDNLVKITIVELVPTQPSILDFEVTQQAQFL